MVVHSADFANSARQFDTTKYGTYMLFEEFFMQGDIEKALELPVSFLCDREATSVCGS